ncbi:hypothetical protein THAOC_23633 [Thalassiosira oceanica]|uniref:Uncharacterized protein n=1 Tax=Thalassiosira oceanica TaxID=159749 RepID=K0SCN7_THAOC|nr:hypothetical protein THAOC_23633 [Thalassiosira oceanica]|eukprot:EJK56472.1 hypothetical protein THAOC_23633 [Thalassiosira oceanica]
MRGIYEMIAALHLLASPLKTGSSSSAKTRSPAVCVRALSANRIMRLLETDRLSTSTAIHSLRHRGIIPTTAAEPTSSRYRPRRGDAVRVNETSTYDRHGVVAGFRASLATIEDRMAPAAARSG